MDDGGPVACQHWKKENICGRCKTTWPCNLIRVSRKIKWELVEPNCRHCSEKLVKKQDYWTHHHSLYRCQRLVSYGHNAAHPDIPCQPGDSNPCKCTYAPDF